MSITTLPTFVVTGIKTGKCIACEREVECFVVESQRLQLSGLLCPADFRRQVKVATANSNGHLEKQE